MRKDQKLSRDYSNRYKERIEIFWDDATKTWYVRLNGKYFTEYPQMKINHRHLREALQFRKKIPEHWDHARKGLEKHKADKARHKKDTMRDAAEQCYKDLEKLGYEGKKTFIL